MKQYNVTYWDLINKPVQGKIFIQSLIEDGQIWYESGFQESNKKFETTKIFETTVKLSVRKGDEWRERFNDYTKFTTNFDPLVPKIWAIDMIAVIEKFEGEIIENQLIDQVATFT